MINLATNILNVQQRQSVRYFQYKITTQKKYLPFESFHENNKLQQTDYRFSCKLTAVSNV